MNFSYLSNGKNQCFVFFIIGFDPEIVDLGFINSPGLSVEPHFSH